METKVCLECGKEKRIETFGTCKNVQHQKSGKAVVRRKNICQTCFSKRQKARVQLSMLEAFDWKCQCCGENHPEFLSLQHVTGFGRTLGSRASFKEKIFARKHGWNREHFSVLCYNCNVTRQYFGRCPHQVGDTPEQAIERLRKKAEPKRYYVNARFVNKMLEKVEKESS